LAEYIVVHRYTIAQEPDSLGTGPDAAGLFVVACETTAVLARATSMLVCQRALVNGVSGGVGTLLVQVLVGLSVRVTAVCSVQNAEMVKRLGADEVNSS